MDKTLRLSLLVYGAFAVGLFGGSAIVYWDAPWYLGVIGGQVFGHVLNIAVVWVQREPRVKERR